MIVAASLAARQSTSPAWWDYRFLLVTLGLATLVALIRFVLDRRWLARARTSELMNVRGCASLIAGELRPVARGMFFGMLVHAIILPATILVLLSTDPTLARHAITAICVTRLIILLAGEIADRYLFFAASVSTRMPGAPQP
jgi:formate dehydrogenase iron-sulfur subunit